MSDFELKIKIGEAVLELKGEKKDVDEMYDKLNSSFVSSAAELNSRIERLPASTLIDSTVPELMQSNIEFSIPQLKLKLNASEKDWLLIYLYDFTSKGTMSVNQDDFKKYYLENRKSKSANANYTNNLKASADYLNLIDDESMIINDKGIEKVLGLAEGKNVVAQKKTNESSKTTKKSNKTKVNFNKIDLGIPDEFAFVEKFKQYSTKTITDKIYVLLKIYKDEKNIDEFSIDTIHSLLNLVSVDTPDSLGAMMNNFVNRDKTFDRIGKGVFKFKYKGIDKAKEIMENCEQ